MIELFCRERVELTTEALNVFLVKGIQDDGRVY